MPKAMNYTKGSIIYFAGDTDDRVFILSKGNVVVTSDDVETKLPVTEQIKNGEFFGVKSALGHFPREETATALSDSVCVAMTVQEFEKLVSSNKAIIMKMLRVFSNQLRQVHKKIENIMNKGEEINQMSGLYSVAQAFYNDGRWRSCQDVCGTFIKHYPKAPMVREVAEMFAKANAYVKRGIVSEQTRGAVEAEVQDSALKLFELPAFKRFQKTFEDGEVIITEFENGDSFYLIQSGNVQLTKCANDTNKNLDILKPGEFFGEMAILDNSPRSATCVASGRVECLEFNKANFEILITGNPQLALILLKLFCKRIYDQKRRLKILVINDPQARLAAVFCMFNEMDPNQSVADRSRKFNLTIQDMSHWSGLPQNVTRDEMTRFSSAGKIEIFENTIIVKNILDMQRIVDTRSNMRG
ncbi:MAG: Crp/Fnr family transcriptional regulator [Treponema sp.]|nr:Crp/Fnr family transcriptional regulator [Candidatus Treponema equifaecale]